MGPFMRLDDLHIDHVSHDRVVGGCYCDSACRAERAISDAVARLLRGEVMVLGGCDIELERVLPVRCNSVRSRGHGD